MFENEIYEIDSRTLENEISEIEIREINYMRSMPSSFLAEAKMS